MTKFPTQFCLLWTAATSLTIGICMVFGAPGFFFGPLLLAGAQWGVIQRYWPKTLGWMIATLVGGYLALAAMVAMVLWTAQPLLALLVAAAILGLAQGLSLKGVSRRWWAVPVVTIVVLLIAAGWLVPQGVDAGIYGSERDGWVWGLWGLASGALGGALKGLALTWLMPPMPSSGNHGTTP